MKILSVLAFVLSSAALAEDIQVKFSVVDTYSHTPIDWQSGWGLIDVYATSPRGEIIRPLDDRFVFNEYGVYTFSGRGAYVCGLNQGQTIEITPHIVEIRLFGWCE